MLMQALLFAPYVAILSSLVLVATVIIICLSQPVPSQAQAAGFDALRFQKRAAPFGSGGRMRLRKMAWLSSRRGVTPELRTAAVR
jgi:hypothetical protein